MRAVIVFFFLMQNPGAPFEPDSLHTYSMTKSSSWLLSHVEGGEREGGRKIKTVESEAPSETAWG